MDSGQATCQLLEAVFWAKQKVIFSKEDLTSMPLLDCMIPKNLHRPTSSIHFLCHLFPPFFGPHQALAVPFDSNSWCYIISLFLSTNFLSRQLSLPITLFLWLVRAYYPLSPSSNIPFPVMLLLVSFSIQYLLLFINTSIPHKCK